MIFVNRRKRSSADTKDDSEQALSADAKDDSERELLLSPRRGPECGSEMSSSQFLKCRNATVEDQASAGRNIRPMPALDLSMVVYGEPEPMLCTQVEVQRAIDDFY